MKHRSEGATALLGMPGFEVGAQIEEVGELWLHVHITAEVTGCAGCGSRAVGHGRRRAAVRDLPVSGRPVVVASAKRIWRCPDEHCEISTSSESSEAIRPRAALTERARAEMCRRCGQDGDTVAEPRSTDSLIGRGWARPPKRPPELGVC